MDRTSLPTVVLGGGFVGLFATLHLSQQNYPHPMILIEGCDRFTFKPLLYELITDELHAERVCPHYRDLLADNNVSFVRDTVRSIDLHQRCVVLESGKSYNYGKLVIALGSQAAYYNISGAAENTLPFTSATEAISLKTRLQDCLKTALETRDPEKRQNLLTVAIIGAGPAGVELACTLADILPVWYDTIGGDYEEIRIVLVNRSNEILKGDINSRLRQTARKSLDDRTASVELLLDAAVTGITPKGVEYSKNDRSEMLPAATVVWTGGTEPHPLLKTLPVASENRNKRGQLQVTPSLQLPEFSEVFVGGDCSYVSDAPQPPTAQVAYQQGKAIAYNLAAMAAGHSTMPARVNLRGTLMKLGIDEGVANIGDRVELKGELGHLIRQATYLELLPKPFYNFKTTAEWFADELLQRHQPKSIAVPLIWRAAQPEQFQQQMTDTGIPALLDRMADNE
jgi:demethylphylloquinone reductase